MRLALTCIAVTLAVIAAVWAWLGTPIPMPHAPLKPGEKLWCLSYAPYQGSQTPYDPSIVIPAAQIDADMAQMSQMTNCVRVYATDQGLDQVVPIAKRYGMQVLQGIWVSNDPVKTRLQADAALALAERYPETVRAIIVGNEALLRGDISAPDLAALIRSVKAKAKVPVTYADVWEFWLRSPEVAAAVDFVTIHILPYWEDFPIPANQAAAHVDAIRKRVAATFAPKDVIIGEVGWPSQGRMREGALPSPANQAEVIQDVLALAARENYRVNVIEAYDATWKRAQEGVVGGYWGLFDAQHRQMKFAWGAPVSNHPDWQWQAGAGMVFALLVFAVAFWASGPRTPSWLWPVVSLNALAGGLTIGLTIASVPVQSIGLGGWVRLLALAAVALCSPLALTAAMMRGVAVPPLSQVIGPARNRTEDPVALAVGLVAIAALLVAIVTALGLVFDPRYRDFPFAPLTAAIMPFFVHTVFMARPVGARGVTEMGGALILAAAAVYIGFNESAANWQSLWLCALFAAFSLSLARVRGAQS